MTNTVLQRRLWGKEELHGVGAGRCRYFLATIDYKLAYASLRYSSYACMYAWSILHLFLFRG